ncbi:MAG: hypothetical protein WDN69_37785 [Aliidongia sp.]
MIGGVVLALPALRVSGPYFGLTTLVAVLMLQKFRRRLRRSDRRRDRPVRTRRHHHRLPRPTTTSPSGS